MGIAIARGTWDMEKLHINEEYLTKNMSLLSRLKSLIPKQFPNNS